MAEVLSKEEISNQFIKAVQKSGSVDLQQKIAEWRKTHEADGFFEVLEFLLED